MINIISINPKIASLIIFVSSLLIQLSVLLFNIGKEDNQFLPGDESSYHNLAVNIALGNGFSHRISEPYDKWYFREPAYPYLMASVYYVSNFFQPLVYANQVTSVYRPELIFLKIVQILLMSIALYIYYYIFKNITNQNIALVTYIITAISLNLLFHSTFLYRETLVFFLFSIFCLVHYYYIVKNQKLKYLIFLGAITGLLILNLQVYFVIPFFWFIVILKYNRNLQNTIKHFTLYLAFTTITILPHIINVYTYYPDIRILKNFGTSFTYELVDYTSTAMKYHNAGLISSDDESTFTKEWMASSKEQFDKSYNGFYKTKADSLRSLYSDKFDTKKYFFSKFFTAFRKTFFLTKYGHIEGYDYIEKYGLFAYLLFVFLPYFLIGVFGIIGSIFYLKKYYIYMIPFIAHVTLFYFLGSEYRRMIIIYPVLVFFSVLFIFNWKTYFIKLKSIFIKK